jgi:hypothetical protein
MKNPVEKPNVGNSGESEAQSVQVIRAVIVHNGYYLLLEVVSELVFALSVGKAAANLAKISNAHLICSINRAAHFSHSDSRSPAQFLIQPPLDWPSSLNLFNPALLQLGNELFISHML